MSLAHHTFFEPEFPTRFRQYVRERFPLPVVVAYVVLSTACVASYVASRFSFELSARRAVLAGLTFLVFFVRLRLADELKDYAYDVRHHPERAVARGLLKVGEVRNAVLLLVLVECLLQIGVGSWGLLWFGASLLFSLLMFREFFMPRLLQEYLLAALLLHQVIFILYAMYAANALVGFFWPARLSDYAMLVLAYMPPLLFEVGRKMEHRHDAAGNVTDDTYRYRWGITNSLLLAGGAVTALAASFFLLVGVGRPILILPVFIPWAAIVLVCLIRSEYALKTAKIWTVLFAIVTLLSFLAASITI